MSRAFVSEQDGETAAPLPDRPVSPHPNYVTPAGLEALRAAVAALQAERAELAGRPDDLAARGRLREVDRDLRWTAARVSGAIVVDPAAQPRDEVRFGATVTYADEDAVVHTVTIVGEDEADAAAGKVSWVSPLARALAGATAGDEVTWRRPAGDQVLTVLRIA